MPQVAVHRADLQAGRAAARNGVGQVLPLADQRLERLALAAGPVEVHQREAGSMDRYSSQWIGTRQRSAQSRTKRKVASTSLPVFANQTTVSAGRPTLDCNTRQRMKALLRPPDQLMKGR